jgi:hypothetical protein
MQSRAVAGDTLVDAVQRHELQENLHFDGFHGAAIARSLAWRVARPEAPAASEH